VQQLLFVMLLIHLLLVLLILVMLLHVVVHDLVVYDRSGLLHVFVWRECRELVRADGRVRLVRVRPGHRVVRRRARHQRHHAQREEHAAHHDDGKRRRPLHKKIRHTRAASYQHQHAIGAILVTRRPRQFAHATTVGSGVIAALALISSTHLATIVFLRSLPRPRDDRRWFVTM
jgi:hypothetical protein